MSKIHHTVDGRGRPLAVVVTPGQSHDGRALELVLADIWVPRLAVGRPRTTPAAVLGDKAYSSRGNREMLRRRGIKVVIPEPSDQQANRKRRGAKGGRPPKLDRETYKQRNVVERSFNLLKQWRGLATRYDKHAVIYRGGAVLAAIIAWLRTSWRPSSSIRISTTSANENGTRCSAAAAAITRSASVMPNGTLGAETRT